MSLRRKSGVRTPQWEYAELRFMSKAAEERLAIARPWGHSLPYDFIFDNGSRLGKVQVKSAMSLGRGGFRLHTTTGASRRALTPRDADFVIGYVVPLDVWYVIPIRELKGCKCVWLLPHVAGSKAKFEKRREAWNLLRSF